jgi:hypothetical protein
MTLTHAGICFLVAVIILGLDFLLGFAGEAYVRYRGWVLALFFIALGLLLAQ